MRVPKLKRIKVSSERELNDRLAGHSAPGQRVMLVTCNKKSPGKYLSRAQVRDALAEHGWREGPSYTLDGHLVGRVISRS